MTRSGRTATPFIILDRRRCEACWKCTEACPESVLGRIDIGFHRHAIVRDGDKCKGCHRCVKACKAGALSARPRKDTTASPPQHEVGARA